MQIKANVKIGATQYQFDVEEETDLKALHKIIVLSNPRKKCQCGDVGYENKYLTTNKDKDGNIYVNAKCAKCGARSKLGSYKSGGFFWHEYEIYQKEPKKESNDPDLDDPTSIGGN